MKKILIAGAGGQGIVSLGKFIAYAAVEEGLNVSCFPAYGPEMRGGAANCSVVYDNVEISSPVIESPDILVAMNLVSLEKFYSFVDSDGYIIIDSALDIPHNLKISSHLVKLPLLDCADKIEDKKSINLIILGALSKFFKDFSLQSVISAVKKVFKEKTQLIKSSLEALKLGYNMV